MKNLLFVFILSLLLNPSFCLAKHVSGTEARERQDDLVTGFVTQAVSEIMSFDSSNSDKVLEEGKKFFTQKGYDSFYNALEKSGIKDRLSSRQESVTASTLWEPVVYTEGLSNGLYKWVVRVPILMDYQAGSKSRSVVHLLTVVIVKSDEKQNSSGIGIQQWIAAPMDSFTSCGNTELISKLRHENEEIRRRLEFLEKHH